MGQVRGGIARRVKSGVGSALVAVASEAAALEPAGIANDAIWACEAVVYSICNSGEVEGDR